MSTETYAIVFKGDIVEGFEAAAVQAQIAKLLKIDPAKAAALFSGKTIVLKKTAVKEEAAKYGKALKRIGADVKVRIVKDDALLKKPAAPATPQFQAAEAPVFQAAETPTFAAAEPTAVASPTAASFLSPDTPPLQTAAPVVNTSGISLAPNEGNIVEPAAPPPPLDIDLSGISVAENDDTFLVEPAKKVVLDLDLSEFSVAENDGSPLVEASNIPIPKVEAPDFGLDEPGAIIETLVVEKVLLNPDTSGISLAMAGSDMIEEEERAPRPPPARPDISKINLVANFDL